MKRLKTYHVGDEINDEKWYAEFLGVHVPNVRNVPPILNLFTLQISWSHLQLVGLVG